MNIQNMKNGLDYAGARGQMIQASNAVNELLSKAHTLALHVYHNLPTDPFMRDMLMESINTINAHVNGFVFNATGDKAADDAAWTEMIENRALRNRNFHWTKDENNGEWIICHDDKPLARVFDENAAATIAAALNASTRSV